MPPDQHVIHELGLHARFDGELRVGRSEPIGELCTPGTSRPMVAVLATYADLLAGHPPGHALASTANLNVTVLRDPGRGPFTVLARTVKVGRTLLVGETTFTSDGEAEPFALSVGTFMNAPGQPADPSEAHWGRGGRTSRPLAARVGVVVVAPGVLELARRPDLTNGLDGTFQGGISCLLGELATASVLADDGAPWVLDHLDVHYLRGVRQGPARTATRVLGSRHAERVTVVVEVHDAGAGHLASYVVATARRWVSSG